MNLNYFMRILTKRIIINSNIKDIKNAECLQENELINYDFENNVKYLIAYPNKILSTKLEK